VKKFPFKEMDVSHDKVIAGLFLLFQAKSPESRIFVRELRRRNPGFNPRSQIAFEDGQLLRVKYENFETILDSQTQIPKYLIIDNITVCVTVFSDHVTVVFGSLNGWVSVFDMTKVDQYLDVVYHNGSVRFFIIYLFYLFSLISYRDLEFRINSFINCQKKIFCACNAGNNYFLKL
jgi:hypothetical protein